MVIAARSKPTGNVESLPDASVTGTFFTKAVRKAGTLDALFHACESHSLDACIEIELEAERRRKARYPWLYPKPEPKAPSRPNPLVGGISMEQATKNLARAFGSPETIGPLTVAPSDGRQRGDLDWEEGPPPRDWNVQTYRTRKWDGVDTMYGWAAQRYRPGCRMGYVKDGMGEAMLWVATRPSWVHEPNCDIQIAADYQAITGLGLRSVDDLRAELGVVPLSSLTCTCARSYASSAVQPR